MMTLPENFTPGSSYAVGGCVPGSEALLLAELYAKAAPASVLAVLADDFVLDQTLQALSFIDAAIRPVVFPGWDCLPYDRVSPSSDVLAMRMQALAALQQPGRKMLLTTCAAFSQKTIRPADWPERHFRIDSSLPLREKDLENFLLHNGYQRTGTVREVGEYAWRGNLLDIFINGQAQPLRIDLFGDRIETMHFFDPITQRKTARAEIAVLHLVATQEVLLHPPAVQNFRSRYRELFGAAASNDPIYAAIAAGHRFSGMEHFLPLFHDPLAPLTDYMPLSLVVLGPGYELAMQSRQNEIADYYRARVEFANNKHHKEGGVYRPLAPENLYLGSTEIDQNLNRVSVVRTQNQSAEPAANLPVQSIAKLFPHKTQKLLPDLPQHWATLRASGQKLLLACYSEGSASRIEKLLGEFALPLRRIQAWQDCPHDIIGLCLWPLEQGFAYGDTVILSEQDLLGEKLSRMGKRAKKAENILLEAGSLSLGDLVVHDDHGIGRFISLAPVVAAGAAHDCLCLEYAGGDKLFVPVENIDVLSRYGADDGQVPLDKLGGVGWQSRKARVKQRLAEMAEQLIRIAAARATTPAEIFPPPHNYENFCARFPHYETEDQLKAIEQTLADLRAGKPMDRLVCGDVGFGKTEVALRAAFVAASHGVQVAVVVPTTLLARQHYGNFQARFAGFPLRVAQLSRLITPADAKAIKTDLAMGKIDIIIGTHALLAKSIEFQNLGLLIVDEEQHFGVAQKERLKEFQARVHVLTLSATPIPRTLQMALSGVRDLSIIATPPTDRHAVITQVLPYDGLIIREAILRERHRGGQCFYVCPRLEDLPEIERQLRELIPDLRLGVAHGQLPPTLLEQVMQDFVEGRFDVLVSTNIIESGLDIPSANTIIIHRADMFGLSQLYQLRGRVGRSKQRAYAYLTIPSRRIPTESAQKRLQVMQTLDHLGAGFSVASHDMDIRGAGNLLGEEQSGQVREVGIELYQNLLQQAVASARDGKNAALTDGLFRPQINLGIPVLIADDYIADLPTRMSFYRRLSQIQNADEIPPLAAELVDRFGALPQAVENLLAVVDLKLSCLRLGIDKIDAGPKGVIIGFYQNQFANPPALVQFIQAQKGTAKLRPDQKLFLARAWADEYSKINGLKNIMQELLLLLTAKAA
jgi:transcription-repair coupling factor (superfamily II helicase)